MKKICSDCLNEADWVRRTQFCGNHYFCAKHAEMEGDFKTEDSSSHFWEEVVKNKQERN